MSYSSQITSNTHNEGATAIPVQVLAFLLEFLKPSICKVAVKNSQGTGSLVAFPLHDTSFAKSFVTCSHVLGSNDRFEIYNAKLQFEVEQMKLIRIRPEWILHVWNSSEQFFDATIIEFNSLGVDEMEKRGAKFLKITKPEIGQQVIMLQYPNGVYSLDGNHIEEINGYEIMYHLGADNGSSGSPLVTYGGDVVGVHRRRDESRQRPLNDPLPYRRYGSHILKLKDAYLKERRR